MLGKKLGVVALVVALMASGVQVVGVGAQETSNPGFGGTASISGVVTFTNGRPVVNRPVEWRPVGNPNGGSTVQTASDGAYTIMGLRDGEYFIGYFPPDRVPADKNPNVERAPDATSAELNKIGAPQVRRVSIVNARSVKGIDFVITDIGNEQVVGPDTGDAGATGLPATGAAVATQNGSKSDWVKPLALASLALVVLGVFAAGWPIIARRRR